MLLIQVFLYAPSTSRVVIASSPLKVIVLLIILVPEVAQHLRPHDLSRCFPAGEQFELREALLGQHL